MKIAIVSSKSTGSTVELNLKTFVWKVKVDFIFRGLWSRVRSEGGKLELWVPWLSRLDTLAMDSQIESGGSVNKDEKEKLDKLYSLMPHLSR